MRVGMSSLLPLVTESLQRLQGGVGVRFMLQACHEHGHDVCRGDASHIARGIHHWTVCLDAVATGLRIKLGWAMKRRAARLLALAVGTCDRHLRVAVFLHHLRSSSPPPEPCEGCFYSKQWRKWAYDCSHVKRWAREEVAPRRIGRKIARALGILHAGARAASPQRREEG